MEEKSTANLLPQKNFLAEPNIQQPSVIFFRSDWCL